MTPENETARTPGRYRPIAIMLVSLLVVLAGEGLVLFLLESARVKALPVIHQGARIVQTAQEHVADELETIRDGVRMNDRLDELEKAGDSVRGTAEDERSP